MKFWIGDPCYHDMFQEDNHPVWLRYLEESNYIEFTEAMTFDGRKIAASTTAHGDGTFRDMQGREYGVDSGSIGFIEWKEGDAETMEGLHLLEAEEVPQLIYDDELIVITGGGLNVVIDTAPDEEEDEVEELDEALSHFDSWFE